MIIGTPWPCTCLDLSKFNVLHRSYEIFESIFFDMTIDKFFLGACDRWEGVSTRRLYIFD